MIARRLVFVIDCATPPRMRCNNCVFVTVTKREEIYVNIRTTLQKREREIEI